MNSLDEAIDLLTDATTEILTATGMESKSSQPTHPEQLHYKGFKGQKNKIDQAEVDAHNQL